MAVNVLSHVELCEALLTDLLQHLQVLHIAEESIESLLLVAESIFD